MTRGAPFGVPAKPKVSWGGVHRPRDPRLYMRVHLGRTLQH